MLEGNKPKEKGKLKAQVLVVVVDERVGGCGWYL